MKTFKIVSSFGLISSFLIFVPANPVALPNVDIQPISIDGNTLAIRNDDVTSESSEGGEPSPQKVHFYSDGSV